jgi:hypothetical protein
LTTLQPGEGASWNGQVGVNLEVISEKRHVDIALAGLIADHASVRRSRHAAANSAFVVACSGLIDLCAQAEVASAEDRHSFRSSPPAGSHDALRQRAAWTPRRPKV